jgi:membrane fusion protein (multidrug efflux system)
LKGKITSFSRATGAKFSLLPPDNATGNFVKVVQRVPVKIEFTGTPAIEKQLSAGMSVNVAVSIVSGEW